MKLCEFCGKIPVKEKRNKFCSTKCMGLARTGKNHPMFGKISPMRGKHHSAEAKRKISEAEKGNTYALGLKHSEEAKRKNSESHKGQVPWNKGQTKETDLRIKKYSEKLVGRTHTEEHKKRNSEAHKGKNSSWYGRSHTAKTKKKMRLSAIKRIEKNNGFRWPSYNKQACEYFKKFDEDNNTKGRYAVYGGGEYLIEKLGYWPDYINFNIKLIMEWDEENHYKNGKLHEKDIQRQKEIQTYYPDFEFRRIRETLIA